MHRDIIIDNARMTFSMFYITQIGSLIVSVLVSSAVDRGFEPRLCQTKDDEFGICCVSAKHALLSSKCEYWLSRNQVNAYEVQ